MKQFIVLSQIEINHAYYERDQVVPLDLKFIDQPGDLKLRRTGNSVALVGPEGHAVEPTGLTLAIVPTELQIMEVTEGANWDDTPVLKVTADGPINLAAAPITKGQSRPPLLGQLHLTTLRNVIELRFAARTAHWAYHILGAEGPLHISDADGQVEFIYAGIKVLPDGHRAHVFRSNQPLALAKRSSHRFTLKTDGDFGPKTLIEQLPSAQPPLHHSANPPSLQADIFITL